MTEVDSIPWVERYRPKKLNDLTQDSKLLDLLTNVVKTGEMPHFLFYGYSGTGKTSAILAMGREIFKEFFSSRVIEFNASDDRGINAVREKITNEAKKYVSETVSADGTKIPPYKIIILDEADSMTDEAQDALRVIIEQYSTVTRFCFICNYISKITDAIKSRCSAVYFKKLSLNCMLDKLNDIANNERMNLPDQILNTIIEVSNGDMRKAIMLLQNVKYLYDFKNVMTKKLTSMDLTDLKKISIINLHRKFEKEITINNIYEIAASIPVTHANEFINDVLSYASIAQVTKKAKDIIALGYPIDNILGQLNKAIIINTKLTEKQKANIINYSGKIFLKMKNCANEYLQLVDYLSCIYGVTNNIDIYDSR